MPVKAKDQVTVVDLTDVQSVTVYYLLQLSTLSAPAKPTTLNPSNWSTTEPSFANDTTNTLYTCVRTLFRNGTFGWSDVSVSSSYEAAKAAYNKAQEAQSTANAVQTDLDNNYTDTAGMTDAINIKFGQTTLAVVAGTGADAGKLFVKVNGGGSGKQGTIDLTGLVKFTDLSTAGSTEINGGNIKTGKITAIDIEGVNIMGADVSGGTVSGALIKSLVASGLYGLFVDAGSITWKGTEEGMSQIDAMIRYDGINGLSLMAENKIGISTNGGAVDIDGALTVNGKTIAERTVLYNNTSGTNASFTLSETAANFNMLRIFYTADDGVLRQSVDIYDPNGKTASLSLVSGDANYLYFKFATITISGTSATWGTNGHAWAPNGGAIGINATSKPIKIVRVEGFKY